MDIFTSTKPIFKTVFFSTLFISCTLSSLKSQSFITTWNTANPGTSNANSITIPTGPGAFNYDVDWNNDGIFDQIGIAAAITHDFGAPGIYTIRIKGNFPTITFNNAGDKLKIIEINQWGNIAWASMRNSFYGCVNLICTATDIPDLSSVPDMSSMFRASGITGDFSAWNVSKVTDMSYMFSFAPNFNSAINNWNLNNVTNMRGMFWGATLFNQPLNNWDVSNVEDMSFMFFFAEAFNQNLNSWDVSKVINMSSTFSFTPFFNGDVSSWDVSNVSVMTSMFSSANTFNQDLGGWNISSVTDMSDMLSNTGLSINKYDNTLIGWASQNVKANVSLGVNGLEYCEGETARNNLIALDNWNIVGDNKYCNYFITTWKTDFPGTSNNTSITIPTTGGGYNYDVDWDNDGIFDQIGINGDVTHDFGVVGIYTIQIRGDFPRIHFDNLGDKSKILDISRWGNIKWENMASAFYGCNNLNMSATDSPDLTNVTNMASMFQAATNFNGDISDWDVSNVTSMAFMFHSTPLFNQDLSSWNVSKVTDMSRMFYFAGSFNSDLNNWDVSSVNNMSRMFQSATSFNKSLSNWDVSTVTNMEYMFRQASSFNQPIDGWDVSNVTNMSNMFTSANAFDQKLGNWNISNVQNMVEMLSYTNLSSIHYDATLIGWGGQSVQNGVIFGAEGLTYCEGDEPRSILINSTAWTITGDSKACSFITTWKTDNPGVSPDNAITISTIDGGYNYDVDWNNDGIFDQLGINGSVSHIFPAPGTYTIRIRGDFPRMYFNPLGDQDKIIDIVQWGDILWTSMNSAFFGCTYLNSTATDSPNLSLVSDMYRMFKNAISFNGDLSEWNVENVNNMREMFRTTPAFNGDLSNWDVSNVTDMGVMFDGATIFNSDISNWDVSSVTQMNLMFANTNEFNIDIGSWDVSKVTNMVNMFNEAKKFNHDLNNWNVSNVTDMSGMFHNTDEFNGNISSWDVSKVTNMFTMFGSTVKFNGNISNWDVSNVTGMSFMFSQAEHFNRDLSNWDVSKVTNMRKMFYNANSINQNLGVWDISSVTIMEDMLSGSALSKENYDNTLIGWASQNTQSDVELGADDLTYCAGEAARLFLINLRNWSITGDELNCSALPIEIIAFDAQINDRNQVNLVWETATEVNNDFFTIERSKDGIQFEALTEIEGAGNADDINFYSTEDVHPYSGISYYRLKQTDFDGTSSYSEVKSVNIKIENGFKAFPNPMQDVIHLVNENLPQGPISIEIYDILGKTHYSKKLETDGKILSLDINEVALLQSGTYFLVVREEDITHSFKLTKVSE